MKHSMTYLHLVELLAVALAFLERSRIARFLTAKIGLDVIVEVTDKFGPEAGHTLSTFVSLLIAEPHLIAVFLTVILLLFNGILFLAGRMTAGRRPKKAQTPDKC